MSGGCSGLRSEWGEYFRSLRLARKLTLRRLQELRGWDPALVCRHERGIKHPSREYLDKYAEVLGLKPDSRESQKFYALAMRDSGRIPSPLREGSEKLLQSAILLALEDGYSREDIMGLVDSMGSIQMLASDFERPGASNQCKAPSGESPRAGRTAR